MENLARKVFKDIAEEKKDIASDYHRLSYHIMPPKGLLNDPNGFIHFNGEYHLFYQWNPFECAHGAKFWGHFSSKDLVEWEEHSPALAPVEPFEKNGCYSGSAVEVDGKLILIYTGNVKDEMGNRESYQCLAESKDGVNFEKRGPVIDAPPHGYTKHFRDPKVWKKDNLWYMVIGGQTKNLEGRVLLYTSKNLKEWIFKGEIAGSNLNGLGEFGYMWECPDMFQLDGRDVLIASPQGIESQGDKYNNIYQSGYFLGSMKYEEGYFHHNEFCELDRGFEFYAPQTTYDESGRRLLFGWMGLPEEEEHPTVEKGWIHAMTLPRELYIKGEKLYQKPARELEKLRKESIIYEDAFVDQEISLNGIDGDSYEMILEITDFKGTLAGLKLRCSEQEETIFYLDLSAGKAILDRERSGDGYGGIRKCSLDFSQSVKLHIFVDKSSLEIFINDGEEVFTSRIFPAEKSQGVKFFSDKGFTIKKIVKYNI